MRYSVIALVTIAIAIANILGRETGYRHGLRDASDVAAEERRWHDEIAARMVAAHAERAAARGDCPVATEEETLQAIIHATPR
ncbi:MAG: hypothetical protein DI556_06570 [Rhodovulum sulfidophilum]|uniref:Uncharacterized protein n=1 Tax=Rhodovulum sulfidophilum TaxID=35806 RepID=A0A2W5Q0M0_RHOSU|nr:MAG: hypothetical protein DI556_06570 [Rhodovulum sulfidophilum]